MADIAENLGCFVLQQQDTPDMALLCATKERKTIDHHTVKHAICDGLPYTEWNNKLKMHHVVFLYVIRGPAEMSDLKIQGTVNG